MFMVWFVISWFVVGFVVFLLVCAEDMRGVPYNQCFADRNCLAAGTVMFTLLGYITLVIYIAVKVSEEELFSKFIYWLCNLDVKEGTE